jgi:hypothetical protein
VVTPHVYGTLATARRIIFPVIGGRRGDPLGVVRGCLDEHVA